MVLTLVFEGCFLAVMGTLGYLFDRNICIVFHVNLVPELCLCKGEWLNFYCFCINKYKVILNIRVRWVQCIDYGVAVRVASLAQWATWRLQSWLNVCSLVLYQLEWAEITQSTFKELIPSVTTASTLWSWVAPMTLTTWALFVGESNIFSWLIDFRERAQSKMRESSTL